MNRIAIASCIAFLLVVTAVSPLLAQTPKPFSADLKVSNSPKVGKLYFADGKSRMETEMMEHPATILQDDAKQKSYILMDDKKKYMEAAVDPSWGGFNAANPCQNHSQWKCEKKGNETLNGQVCTMWRVVDTKKDSETTIWIDQKTNIMIKSKNAGGTIELSNIKFDPPKPELLKIPAEYTKFEWGQ